MAKFVHDSGHFKAFSSSLDGILRGYDTDEEHYIMQKRQVENLCALEVEFRNTLIRDWRGPGVYKKFIKYVRDEQRNILSARPFFRERQDVFKEQIAPALRERADKSLYKFNINYTFIAFVMALPGFHRFEHRSRVARLARKIMAARKELIEMNLPLAICRARAFSFFRQHHVEYMDLVQVATEGLIAAIDKFVLPYQKSFGAVMYGRITGDLVEANNETLVHFWPIDKRQIYTANKLVKEGKTFDQIADHINTESKRDINGVIDPTKKDITNGKEVQLLHIGAYTISGDALSAESAQDDSGLVETPITRFEADESWRPDLRVEEEEIRQQVKQEIKKFSMFERKLMLLKGIHL